MRKNYLIAWPALIVLVAITAVIVILPAWLIQPFGAQTSRGIEVSFLLRRWSPIVTVVLALLAIATAVYIWLKSRKLYGKLSLLIPVSLVLVFTWFARQNHFEWMFNPLKHSDYVAASKADFVEDSDMMLAVNIAGDAVAYPVRQMAYHHVVQDVVGGTPITATY